jgi:translation initiation factor 4E
LVGDEVVGAVCSVRNQEELKQLILNSNILSIILSIVSVWNRTAKNGPVTNRIRDTLRRVLNLPANAILEYKRHGLFVIVLNQKRIKP